MITRPGPSTLTIVAAVFLVPGIVQAAEYYVDPAGDDQNDGSPEAPLATVQAAADRVAPGDTVYVAAGTYGPFRVTTDGMAGSPITFVSTGAVISGTTTCGNRPCSIYVEASYVTLDGFEVRPDGQQGVLECGVRLSNGGFDAGPEKEGDVVRNCTVVGAGWVGISSSRVNDLLVEFNDVSGSRDQHGIYIANSTDRTTLRYNRIYDNNNSGIQINADPAQPGDGIATEVIIAFNQIYNNGLEGPSGGSAINLASVRDSFVVGNLLYQNHAGGISNWDDGCNDESFGDGPCAVPKGTWGCKNNVYLFNTVVQAGDGRKPFTLRAGSTEATVMNNILLHAGNLPGFGVDTTSLVGLASDFNIMEAVEDTSGQAVPLAQWQQDSGQDANSFVATAATLFVGGTDFHLAEGSPAIDRGTDVAAQVPFEVLDMDGHERPAGAGYDIGADEFGSMPPPGGGTGGTGGTSGTGGMSGTSGGSTSAGGVTSGGSGGETGGGGSSGASADEDPAGCACVARRREEGAAGLGLLMLMGLLGRRSRRRLG